MMRRISVVFPFFLAACGPPQRTPVSLLPENVAGVWQRKSLRDLPPPKATITRAFEAVYEGPGKLTVDLYEAKVSGTAFEMTQHQRATPDTVFFDRGRYFVVVKWERAERQKLKDFMSALEKNLRE
jgi:hypothetical protein